MKNKLEISYLGHEILRATAKPVVDIEDKSFQKLIDDMMYTVKAAKGLGIAAPQVYQQQCLFIMASKPSVRYPNAPTMEPIAIINPQITNYYGSIVKDWEGCLSIPGIRGHVPRYTHIDVIYTDRKGNKIEKTLHHFIARIFQHEIDHLNGIVFLDRLEANRDIITEQVYQELVTNKAKNI